MQQSREVEAFIIGIVVGVLFACAAVFFFAAR